MSDPLARNSDPNTSVIAAKRAREFAGNHSALILGSLGTPGSAYDIAKRTGLTAVQIDRRIHELIADHLIAVVPKETRPSPTGNPCRVYRQLTFDETAAAKLLQPELFA